MNVIKTELEGVLLIEPNVFGDNRGLFFESYNEKEYKKNGIDVVFIQDNHSFSAQKGTIRGIHFQKDPMSQAKLVRCTVGIIKDVIVDLRKESPTYKKWISVVLSKDNRRQVFIPHGFGHGFVTLTDNCELQYKVDEYYSKEHDRSILWNDKEIGIEWGEKDPILSEKDKNAPPLALSDVNF